jgi:hypothetical protein
MKRILSVLFVTLALQSSYAQDISKGVTFTDGMTVHGADLNNAIDNATILPTFFSTKGSATPLTTDLLLFHQNSTSTIKQATVATVMTAGNALNTTTTQSAKTFYGGPTAGSAAAPTFRLLSPFDTSDATDTGGGTTVDCSLARTFSRTLAANTTYTLTNIADGETVTVSVAQAAAGGPYTASFTVAGGITWRAGVTPTQTATASRIDLYSFIHIGSKVYGSASQDYH